MSFAIKLRGVRYRAGLSQERFAARIGTSRRHYMRLEQGMHIPNARLLDAICEATGCFRADLGLPEDESEAASTMLTALDLRLLRTQMLMRHAHAKTTADVYLHLDQSDLADTMSALPAWDSRSDTRFSRTIYRPAGPPGTRYDR